jgi:hypothetical protein
MRAVGLIAVCFSALIKCNIMLILAAPPCAAMAINGVEISSSDPGAVPGASTQARY